MRSDRDKQGGGILIAYKKKIKNMVIEIETNTENYEGLIIKIDNQITNIKLAVIYFPQENAGKTKREKAYKELSKEIKIAQVNKENMIVMGDFNAKLGRNDKNEKETSSGRLLKKFIAKEGLVVGNHLTKTRGRWTRIEGEKKSEIDYVIATKQGESSIKSITIDEKKMMSMYYHDNEGNCIYPDHNAIKTTIQWKKLVKCRQAEENCIIMTEDGYQKYAKELEEKQVSKSIDKNNDFSKEYEKWINNVTDIYQKNQKKLTKGKKSKVNRKLMSNVKRLKKKLRKGIHSQEENKIMRTRIQLLKEHCESEIISKNQNMIQNAVKKISKTGKSDLSAFWDLNKKTKTLSVLLRKAVIDEGEKS